MKPDTKIDTEFFKDFSPLLSDELKQQGKSNDEIQATIKSLKTDTEFAELRDILQEENALSSNPNVQAQATELPDIEKTEKTEDIALADTTTTLNQDTAELHKTVKELGELEKAIENYADRNAHIQQNYFEAVKIPATPALTSTVAPTTSAQQATSTQSTPEPGE